MKTSNEQTEDSASWPLALMGVLFIAANIFSPIEGLFWPYVVGWIFILAALFSPRFF